MIGLLFVFFACNDDEVIPLTPDLVTETKLYDLGNNGDASDLRVDFKVNDNLNVAEYRVMILPSSIPIDVSVAQALSQSSYVSIAPSTGITYSVNRLPASLLDVNGNAVTNGTPYTSGVLAVGTGDVQLSSGAFSGRVVLADQGIYSGRYFPTAEGTCLLIDGSSAPFFNSMELILLI